MIEYAIQQCSGQDLVIQESRPFGRCLVSGDDKRGALVDAVDEVEEGDGLPLFHWEEHDIVNNNQICLSESFVFCSSRAGNILKFQRIEYFFHSPEVCLIAFLDGVGA